MGHDSAYSRSLLLDTMRYERALLGEALAQAPTALTGAPEGMGVYLLLYVGPLTIYKSISDGSRPIYVGQTQDFKLRMAEHFNSISQTKDLRVCHFRAVFCPQPTEGARKMAETTFQELFKPVWNHKDFNGFGSRDQGRGRVSVQGATAWDRAHPGRAWALPQLGANPRPDRKCRRAMRQFLAEHGGPLPTWRIEGKDSALPASRSTRYALGQTNQAYQIMVSSEGTHLEILDQRMIADKWRHAAEIR